MRFYMRLTFFVQLFFFLPVHTPQCQLMQPYTHRHLQVYQKKSVYRLKKENITSTFRRGAFGQEKKTVETHLALEFSFITKGRKNQYCRQQKSINAQIRVQNMALSLFFLGSFSLPGERTFKGAEQTLSVHEALAVKSRIYILICWFVYKLILRHMY